MKKYTLFGLILVLAVLFSGCVSNPKESGIGTSPVEAGKNTSNGTIGSGGGFIESPDKETGNSSGILQEGTMPADGPVSAEVSFSGKVLSGTASKYLEFSESDYSLAKSSGKIIFLDFYANWCPTCKAEAPAIFKGFSELNQTEIVGFRVNYKDSDTEEAETSLAKEFGIPYQHTKVILQNGQVVLKSSETWNEKRVSEELLKVLAAS